MKLERRERRGTPHNTIFKLLQLVSSVSRGTGGKSYIAIITAASLLPRGMLNSKREYRMSFIFHRLVLRNSRGTEAG
jgi:hypothetical protein